MDDNNIVNDANIINTIDNNYNSIISNNIKDNINSDNTKLLDENIINSSKTSKFMDESDLIKNNCKLKSIYDFGINSERKTTVLSDYLDNIYDSQFDQTVLNYLTNSNKIIKNMKI